MNRAGLGRHALVWLEFSLCLFAFVGATGPAQATEGTFRAAVVKIDVTPAEPQWILGFGPRRSEGVLDRVYLRIVAMDDGKTQVVLISSDFAAVSPVFSDEVRKTIEKETGVGATQVWWTVTHNHSGPEVGPPGMLTVYRPNWKYEHETASANLVYTEWVKKLLIDGIKQARLKLESARLGVGTGFSMANVNRRARDADGSIIQGMNPDKPVDRQIGLIRLVRTDGSLLALIANYAMHGTVLTGFDKPGCGGIARQGKPQLISGDAPGVVAEYVESKLGAPMLYINGAAGNVAPIYSCYPDPGSGHLSQFKVLLGDRVLQAAAQITATTSDVQLWSSEKIIETPLKAGLTWPESLSAYVRVTSAGIKLVRTPVHFLRINRDIAIWGMPVELFCEIAMNVRNQSPFPYTFYFGYLNGFLGYFPTEVAFAEGGYEPNTTPYTGQAERDFTEAIVTYLQGMRRD